MHTDDTVDEHRGHAPRRITLLFYPSCEWSPQVGGLLQLHQEAGPVGATEGAATPLLLLQGSGLVTVAPACGRLVLLASAVPHAVTPVWGPRFVMAGWVYEAIDS